MGVGHWLMVFFPDNNLPGQTFAFHEQETETNAKK